MERQRLKSMGLRVPASLGYSETPVDQFLGMLAAVARLRERGNGGILEGGVAGRLEGTFMEIGSGTGLLTLAAALHHDFHHVIGYEILQGLFDVSLDLEAIYNGKIRGRVMRRADRDFPTTRFVVGDALSLKWNASATPSVRVKVNRMHQLAQISHATCLLFDLRRQIDGYGTENSSDLSLIMFRSYMFTHQCLTKQ